MQEVLPEGAYRNEGILVDLDDQPVGSQIVGGQCQQAEPVWEIAPSDRAAGL